MRVRMMADSNDNVCTLDAVVAAGGADRAIADKE